MEIKGIRGLGNGNAVARAYVVGSAGTNPKLQRLSRILAGYSIQTRQVEISDRSDLGVAPVDGPYSTGTIRDEESSGLCLSRRRRILHGSCIDIPGFSNDRPKPMTKLISKENQVLNGVVTKKKQTFHVDKADRSVRVELMQGKKCHLCFRQLKDFMRKILSLDFGVRRSSISYIRSGGIICTVEHNVQCSSGHKSLQTHPRSEGIKYETAAVGGHYLVIMIAKIRYHHRKEKCSGPFAHCSRKERVKPLGFEP
ncbi:hypothetical protein Tco_0005126 [Tanacetum coccineum]